MAQAPVPAPQHNPGDEPPTDLRPGHLGELPWGEGEVKISLQRVHDHFVSKCLEAIDWYLEAKVWKKRLAQFTRFGAVALASLAALLPLLAQLLGSQADAPPANASWGAWWLQPAWASLLLALAASLVAVDRFFGYSNGWMRFINAEMQLRQLLEEFQMDWEQSRARLRGATPDPDKTQELLALCRVFVVKLNAIVRDETNTWMAEFRDSLRQVDAAVQARTAELTPAAVTVVVANGDQCDPPGWRLSVDGGDPDPPRGGRTAALASLYPSRHTLRATGTIKGSDVQAEAAVSLAPGSTTTVELTLA